MKETPWGKQDKNATDFADYTDLGKEILDAEHHAQALYSLTAMGLRLALLLDFNTS